MTINSNRTKPRTGTIMDVEHIVIFMQENRSFDHYFGTMKGVRGFGDRFPIPLPGPAQEQRTVWSQRYERPGAPAQTLRPFHLDTRHSFAQMRVEGTPHIWPDAQHAWNQGILDAWPSHKEIQSMAYYTQADIPFQFALADMFTICDAYHASLQAGTNPNRVYAWTGSVDPFQQGHGPVIGNAYDNLDFDPTGGYAWTTYPERLQQAGVSWQVYQDMHDNYTDNPLAGFRTFRNAFAGRPDAEPQLRERAFSSRSLGQLKRDVQENNLPQVSFIVATAAGSEHPLPSSPAQGADYTAAVLDALTANPEVWRSTVLFLMFDENDGFFDHVPPPAVPSYAAWHENADKAILAGASTISTEGEYHEFASTDETESPELMHRPYGLGPRVPMYVISPWSKGGWVNSQVFDHTSVIRFMEQRFGVMEPNITPWRRAVCGDLCSAFDFSKADDRPFMDELPETKTLAERARQLAGLALPVPAPAQHLPQQLQGTRPSRALPYELHVADSVFPDRIELRFANTGKAAAVFHVYDRQQLQLVPRRYTVEPGRELRGTWLPAEETDRYDLWVLGPNGFHRHVAGSCGSDAALGVTVSYQVEEGSITARLSNAGSTAASFTIAANAYRDGAPATVLVAPGSQVDSVWPLAQSAYWYDFSVGVEGLPVYLRRFAGRVETGKDGVSDPAMGLV